MQRASAYISLVVYQLHGNLIAGGDACAHGQCIVDFFSSRGRLRTQTGHRGPFSRRGRLRTRTVHRGSFSRRGRLRTQNAFLNNLIIT